MPGGGQLQIHTRQADGFIRIDFSDTGVGMSAEVMDHLFEPFYSTKTNGSGLGLAVSHEIVSQHGGTIEAFSRRDHGSTFTVTLPVFQPDEGAQR
jgi:two-component system sensor histidine kinase AtoS